VKAAGPRARLDQDAPDHPLGRDQIGKLELDVHQLFTQVLGLPSELDAALPDPIEHPAHRSPLPPEIVISALSIERCDRDGRIADGVMVNDGEHAMTVIRELLARPDVTLVDLRNVGYGCYNFAVRRG
jgi:hypothetical protein